MRRTLRKIKFFLIKTFINIYALVFSKKFKKSVAIISCDLWKNKILEDIKLKYYLNKNNIKAEIVSWEKEFEYSKYDAIVIRSVWGFDYDKFQDWLSKINKKVKVINSYELITGNFSKQEQFNLLDKYSIEHIETNYLKSNKQLKQNVKKIWKEFYSKYDKIVIKPAISESGNNTFILSNEENNKKCIKLDELNNKYRDNDITLMLQPFIEEIKDGEISVISFNKKISHAVVRHPGVFDNCYKVSELDLELLPKDIKSSVNKIINLDEYKDYTYMRIDFVKSKDKYLVLEVELIDPILFINNLKNKKEVYFDFVKQIIDKL